MTQSINTKQLKKPWVAIGGINAVGNRRAVGVGVDTGLWVAFLEKVTFSRA